MGRKIAMKKIENITKCQVTFSKRRSWPNEKANEISVCCDVDVAFVAFSPSGRVSKFCSQKRIEDVLRQFVSLSADKRLDHISNIEAKMEKLQQLGHINGDTSKLQFLDKQIENLELQIKKSGLEMQIFETDLRDFELCSEQESSLHQLCWCERNLNHSLQRVMTRKESLMMEQIELRNHHQAPYSSTYHENGQASMQLDPWISPYSARVRENIFQDLSDKGKHTTNGNFKPLDAPNIPIRSSLSNFPIRESSNIFGSENMTSNIPITSLPVSFEKPVTMDQPLLNLFHDQINSNQRNITHSTTQIWSTTQGSGNIQNSRFTSSTATATPNLSRLGMSEYTFSNLGLDGEELAGQRNMDYSSSSFVNANPRNHNAELEDYRRISCDGMQKNDQSLDVYVVQQPERVHEQAHNDHLFPEGIDGDGAVWTNRIQRTGLWEWDELLLDSNFNMKNLSQY